MSVREYSDEELLEQYRQLQDYIQDEQSEGQVTPNERQEFEQVKQELFRRDLDLVA